MTDLVKKVNVQYPSETTRLAKIAFLYRDKVINTAYSNHDSFHDEKDSPKLKALNNTNSKKILPKIVGDTRHYPPANKEWKNSVYAYNKSSIRSLAAQDTVANKIIKSYFNLTDNKKLARSHRMRTLIRRTSSKRVLVSKPEIKQTSDKVNITVYILNREGQFLLRKLYFYKKNMNINRDIYLHKLWLKKNLLAFKNTFRDKKSIRLLARNKKLITKRKNINKTYIHNILIKKYLNSKDNKQLSDSSIYHPQAETVNDKNVRFSNNLESGSNFISFVQTEKVIPVSSKSLSKRTVTFKSLIRKNILKSLKKRKLIKFLKKRERLIQNGDTYLEVNFENKDLPSENQPLNGFNNYLIEKKTKKLELRLRNSSSIIKIKKRLSRFFFFKGRRRKKRSKKIRLPYTNLRLKKEVKFFSFKLVSELKYIRKLFLFRFIKYIFSLLKIKIYLPQKLNTSRINISNTKNTKQYDNGLPSLLSVTANSEQKQTKNSKPFNGLKYEFGEKRELANTVENLKSHKLNSKYNNKEIIIPKVSIFKNRYSHNKLKKIERLNLELLNFLKYIISKQELSSKLANIVGKPLQGKAPKFIFNMEKFDSLYKRFEKKYFLKFLASFFKKEFLYINYFSKFLINKLKFGKYLSGLKYLINKIYSKKVKLNLVNIKYPQLNSDIFADIIASKLKKKLSVLRVLRSSLNLVRLPYDYLSYERLSGYNALNSLTIHKSLNVNYLSEKKDYGLEIKPTGNLTQKQGEQVVNKDPINIVLNRLYPYSFATFPERSAEYDSFDDHNNLNSLIETKKNLDKDTEKPLNKSLKILNIIRYKWVSGVRLVAAGRLTRRYTAARSVFKYRYKGSLKNIDYSQKADITKKNASTVMLRNYVKANSQHSFSKSKRRIGAFGLKATVSSY